MFTPTNGPDKFPLKNDHALHAEHVLIGKFLEADKKRQTYDQLSLKSTAAGRAIANCDPAEARKIVLALIERGTRRKRKQEDRAMDSVEALVDALLRRKLPFEAEDLSALLQYWCVRGMSAYWAVPAGAIRVAERFHADEKLTDTHRELLAALIERLEKRYGGAEWRKMASRVRGLVSSEVTVPIRSGEAWSDDALAFVAGAADESKTGWGELLQHASTASSGKPSAKWTKAAARLVEALGHDFVPTVTRWLSMVDLPRTQPGNPDIWGHVNDDLLDDNNADVLKGLLWSTAALATEEPDLARAIGKACMSAYKKVPGIGPRSVKVGNACVWALGELKGLHGVGQLALLRVRVRFQTAQKGIVKALEATAARVGISAGELEEMGVPTYGLDRVGERREQLGDFTAILKVVSTSSTTLTWLRADGKPQKSVPQAVKDSHADALKDLKAAAKDIQRMVPAQRDRIDGLFLAQRTWPFDKWRQNYLDHPLVGTLARRILWTFTDDSGSRTAIHHEGRFVDHGDTEVAGIGKECEVSLWHPLDADKDDVVAWRAWFARHEVQQPFKQAHREVYLLTDAERTTDIYSNRYAAHILKQHQFNALCAVRGWRNTLRLAVDDSYEPPTLLLPRWSLRAEYWVEGVGEDWNESGVYLYLATDQVRFYDIDAQQRTAHAGGGGYELTGSQDEQARKLETIPPIVLSEVLRDVDLFVGVASLGNDPNWQDGGPDGLHRDYWTDYAFGKLSESAKTRRTVLQELVPRLKIADQCSLEERFLVVKGTRRTYRIHLGSGNILMAPNDQYLCIVPDSRQKSVGDRVFLPFEGDRTLSLVLSKAMLLAADDKIKDKTILSQLAQ